METFINILQLIGGIILSVGYIPQIKQIIKTKSVNDFNSTYLISIATGVGLMEIYAVYNLLHGTAVMFFVTNTIAFLLGLLMLILYLVFRKSKKRVLRHVEDGHRIYLGFRN
jgi:MtN3 and saliva related transmembrane protein